MRPILTADEMRACDASAIAEGIAPLHLMEQAARGALDVLNLEYGSLRKARILVLCGKGNNGGDGMAFARLAAAEGAIVTIALAGTRTEFSTEAAHQYHRAVRKKIRMVTNADARTIGNAAWDIIVDALLGTGAALPPRESYRRLLETANQQQSFRFAIDLPTGLTASGEHDPASTFRADCTATIAAVKPSLIFVPGRLFAGKIHIVPIGIPEILLDAERFSFRLLEQSDVVARFPRRAPDAYKYSTGKVFLLCGSRGMLGASILSSRAAMRTGAGMTILGVPQSLAPIAASQLIETIIAPLPESEWGTTVDPNCEGMQHHIASSNALVIGCGVSKNAETLKTIRAVIARATSPIVLDADGIAAFNDQHELLRNTAAPLILTPHAAELAALLHEERHAVMNDPVMFARHAAKTFQAIVILKGGPTVIATPSGVVFVNPTGNAGMATAGAGDVMSGMIGALLAQGCAPLDAALCAVYVHGRAGDLAAEELTEPGLVAGDLIEYIPAALRALPVERSGIRYLLPQ